MKRFFILVITALFSTMAFAQGNIIAGMRYEITEITVNEEEYGLFMYRDKDGEPAYYLSLGHVEKMLEIHSPSSTFSLSNVDETCLYLGTTTQDVYDMLDTLLALVQEDEGTFVDFPARMATWGERLGDPTVATCVVKKPLIGGKRLVFFFDSRNYTAATYLSKFSIKQLRSGFKLYKKLHPDK